MSFELTIRSGRFHVTAIDKQMEQIEIQLSKSKLTLMAFGSLTFVIAGICFVINPSKFISPVHRNIPSIFPAGIASIIFFGFIGFYIFKKLLNKTPGLTISNNGILDNSSGLSAGFVPWSDITEIREMIIASQRFICLIVKTHRIILAVNQPGLKGG